MVLIPLNLSSPASSIGLQENVAWEMLFPCNCSKASTSLVGGRCNWPTFRLPWVAILKAERSSNYKFYQQRCCWLLSSCINKLITWRIDFSIYSESLSVQICWQMFHLYVAYFWTAMMFWLSWAWILFYPNSQKQPYHKPDANGFTCAAHDVSKPMRNRGWWKLLGDWTVSSRPWDGESSLPKSHENKRVSHGWAHVSIAMLTSRFIRGHLLAQFIRLQAIPCTKLFPLVPEQHDVRLNRQ